MGQAVIRADGLPNAPLDAAAAFHSDVLPQARKALAEVEALTLVFAPAGHEHRAWRLAAVQELAREAAPGRVNAVTGSAETAIEQALVFLANAEGVTGQILAV